MTLNQAKVIRTYEKYKVIKEVYPSIRWIAKKVKLSPKSVHRTLQAYKAQKKAFAIK